MWLCPGEYFLPGPALLWKHQLSGTRQIQSSRLSQSVMPLLSGGPSHFNIKSIKCWKDCIQACVWFRKHHRLKFFTRAIIQHNIPVLSYASVEGKIGAIKRKYKVLDIYGWLLSLAGSGNTTFMFPTAANHKCLQLRKQSSEFWRCIWNSKLTSGVLRPSSRNYGLHLLRSRV